MKCYCGFLQAPTAKLHFDLINEAFKGKKVNSTDTKYAAWPLHGA